MSEIEKMYENAGIKPSKNWQSCLNCNLKTEKLHDEWGEEYLTCMMLERPEVCSDAKEFYPIFTAEKQIELIKWLGKLAGKLEISSNYNDTQYLLYFYLNRKTRDEILPDISTGRSENFKESLAGLINNLWQSLTEEEKQQIKEILK